MQIHIQRKWNTFLGNSVSLPQQLQAKGAHVALRGIVEPLRHALLAAQAVEAVGAQDDHMLRGAVLLVVAVLPDVYAASGQQLLHV